ncbi:Outer dynein arm protein 1 [Eumeta japonica]|uniref:Outer dynein arm protein 1 n=1 Tax=Eumeta variegata TaxID=151549 RepID=A0A4C1TUQ0_EUMVA|nr:Outer dynein arm protein 1 [Eumeta japonica]
MAMIENANNRLRQMENRLEIATKRFGVVNADNKDIREEIDRLLTERNDFNIQWNRTIGQLVKAKEYLMDILEIATTAFNNRDECCRKLEALKWKGLFNLNKDISEMQTYEGELNHLAKLEEFVRIKCSRRICEADEKDEIRRMNEIERCENEINRYDELLNEIFSYSGADEVGEIISRFEIAEIQNFSTFKLLCEYMQESIAIRRELDELRRNIVDQREMNEARTEMQQQKLIDLSEELDMSRECTQRLREKDLNANALMFRVLKGSPVAPLVTFLGNHKQVTKWNVFRFLRILEAETQALIEVAYGIKPPSSPKQKKGKRSRSATPEKKKLVTEPYVELIKPNRIQNLVTYQPCAYCVEDYITNLVYEVPAVPATNEYVQTILHLEDANTKYGIYTLTVPDFCRGATVVGQPFSRLAAPCARDKEFHF